MSEMVERVARAIRAADMKHAEVDNWPVWEEVTSPHKAIYLERARAAIEAMREPTGNMVEAVYGGHFDVYWSYECDGRPGAPADIFTAMIDAALIPAPPEN